MPEATTGRVILLADPDAEATRSLAAALRARGHRVLSVRDGSKALEVAVMRVPDVVLYEVGCPLIDPRTFAEILRANPRTASIPVVVVGPDETADRARGGFRDAFIQKPFNVDEVLARIHQLFRRAEAAEEVRREGSLKGVLGEVSLPDLLQMLAMNRRSGTLHLAGAGAGVGAGARDDDAEAELLLREGRVIDARVGAVDREKALYRVLGWPRGSFTFNPGMPSGPGRIHLSMDEVLLEGMRQQDELAALEGRAPRRDEVLALTVDLARLPEGLHPVTEEVLGLLELFRTAGEVVDNAKATDLEAMRALTTLVERGMVRVLGRAPAEGGGRRLVAPEVAYALHGREGSRATGRRQATLRLVVSAASPGDLRRLVTDLAEIEGWKPEASGHVLEVGLGALGTLRLTEVLEVELMAVPADDSLSPLWRPFGAAAAGGLVLAEGPGGADAVGPLARWLVAAGRPVAVVGADPAQVAEGDGVVGADRPGAGLARLLERVARAAGRRAA